MDFDRLPNEILEEIWRYLDCPKDLGNLSRCSKRLHWICLPFLYATFKQTGRGALPAFIRTIIEKPHLIEYVRNIKVTALDNHHFETIGDETKEAIVDLSALPAEPKDRMRALLPDECLGENLCDLWYQRLLTKISWNALAAFVLLLCSHKIEALTVEEWRTPGPNFLSQVIYLAADRDVDGDPGGAQKNAISFTNLRRVELLSSGLARRFLRYDVPHLLLQVGSLREIRLEGFCPGCMSPFDTWPKREYVFGCRGLAFTACEISLSDIRKVLAHCHSLEHFECRFAPGNDMFRYRDPSEVAEGLFHSKDSLRSLVLAGPTPMGAALAESPRFNRYGSIGSLDQFQKLKSIDIEAQIILGDGDSSGSGASSSHYSLERCSRFAKMFPPSLEHLTIRKYAGIVYEPLLALLESYCIPTNLKAISVSSMSSLANTWIHHLMHAQLKDPADPSNKGSNNFDETTSAVESQRWKELIEMALQKGVVLSVEDVVPIEREPLPQGR
jgi:hypothetical protein